MTYNLDETQKLALYVTSTELRDTQRANKTLWVFQRGRFWKRLRCELVDEAKRIMLDMVDTLQPTENLNRSKCHRRGTSWSA